MQIARARVYTVAMGMLQTLQHGQAVIESLFEVYVRR